MKQWKRKIKFSLSQSGKHSFLLFQYQIECFGQHRTELSCRGDSWRLERDYQHKTSMVSLQHVALCALVLERPVLVTSTDPHTTVKRVQKILQGWPVNSQVTPITTANGASVFSLLDMSLENQRTLYRELRKQKYPLVLVSSPESELDTKLETLLLFNYKDELNDLPQPSELFRFTSLEAIRKSVRQVTITTEMKTYIYDLIVEVRYSRFIKGGIPTYIIADLTDFIRFKAFILEMTFVTPAIVKTCFKIVLPLRLHLIDPEDDPSLLYGSNPTLVQQLIRAIDANDVIDIAISNVRPPI